MSGRTFVLIFFFWAVLTLVTPTLILLSESSKPDLDPNVVRSTEVKVRRMMGYAEKQLKAKIVSAPMEAPTPAPAPEPAAVSKSRKAILTRILMRKLKRTPADHPYGFLHSKTTEHKVSYTGEKPDGKTNDLWLQRKRLMLSILKWFT